MEVLRYLNFYVVFNHKQAVGFCERQFLSAGVWLGTSWELLNSKAEFPQPQMHSMAGGWRGNRREDEIVLIFFNTAFTTKKFSLSTGLTSPNHLD